MIRYAVIRPTRTRPGISSNQGGNSDVPKLVLSNSASPMMPRASENATTVAQPCADEVIEVGDLFQGLPPIVLSAEPRRRGSA